jgi:hypothetical protein
MADISIKSITAILTGAILTALPPLTIYFFSDDISFDRIEFIHKWIDLVGGGIFIAMLFYVITIVLNNTQIKNLDKRKLNEIKVLLESVKEILENQKENEKQVGLYKINVVMALLPTISNEIQKSKLQEFFMNSFESIKEELENLGEMNEIPYVEINSIKELIEKINNYAD